MTGSSDFGYGKERAVDDVHPIHQKPLLGVIPARLCEEQRIQDLAGAIERYVKAGYFNRTVIAWCEEIVCRIKALPGASYDI